jgi:hypothetical protein
MSMTPADYHTSAKEVMDVSGYIQRRPGRTVGPQASNDMILLQKSRYKCYSHQSS